MARNYLLMVHSSIYEKVKLGEEFDISEEGKEDITPIITMIEDIFNRDLKIDELNKKIEIFRNDVYNIKRHKYKLKRNFKGRQKRYK